MRLRDDERDTDMPIKAQLTDAKAALRTLLQDLEGGKVSSKASLGVLA